MEEAEWWIDHGYYYWVFKKFYKEEAREEKFIRLEPHGRQLINDFPVQVKKQVFV